MANAAVRARRVLLETLGASLLLPALAAAVPPAAAPAAPFAVSPADAAPQPIDLPTVLRLARANNPFIAIAQARAAEAYARQEQAEALCLPNLSGGAAYARHDGQIQNSRGEVFTSSRSSLFGNAGLVASFRTADAVFQPLVARQLAGAASAAAQSVNNDVQLEAAVVYFELVRVHAALAINAELLAKATEMLRRAQAADAAGVSKTKADPNRAAAEVALRQEDRVALQGRAAAVSARLAQLLLLAPGADLVPLDSTVLPLTVVPLESHLDALLALAQRQRPDAAEAAQHVGAADARVRHARYGPLLPRLDVGYGGGYFGGGQNNDVASFSGRGDGFGAVVWELNNLGFGNRAQVREREAQALQAQLGVAATQARIGAEVAAAYKVMKLRHDNLKVGQEAVKQAEETWRKLEASSFGLATPQRLYDPLEPLLALQALAVTRNQYLNQVIEYNRAQFQLYTALGQPPEDGLAQLVAEPLAVPVIPAAATSGHESGAPK